MSEVKKQVDPKHEKFVSGRPDSKRSQREAVRGPPFDAPTREIGRVCVKTICENLGAKSISAYLTAASLVDSSVAMSHSGPVTSNSKRSPSKSMCTREPTTTVLDSSLTAISFSICR